jgi:hypothetical protein
VPTPETITGPTTVCCAWIPSTIPIAHSTMPHSGVFQRTYGGSSVGN